MSRDNFWHVVLGAGMILGLAGGWAVGESLQEGPAPLEEPVPVYVILPDTTRLHLNGFDWICTIDTNREFRT